MPNLRGQFVSECCRIIRTCKINRNAIDDPIRVEIMGDVEREGEGNSMGKLCLTASLQYVRCVCSPSWLIASSYWWTFSLVSTLSFALNFPQCVVDEMKEEAAIESLLLLAMINACCAIHYNLVTSLLFLSMTNIFFPILYTDTHIVCPSPRVYLGEYI